MGVSLEILTKSFDSLWPLSGADEWDKPGLIVGSKNQTINKVLLTVDITNDLIEEAIDAEFDLVLAHHPFLLRGINTAAEATGKGSVLAKSIRANLAIYSAHTNADITEHGVSATLATAVGLRDARALVATSSAEVGHGRIGKLSEPIKLGELARHLAKVLPATATGIRVAGDYDKVISTVALCGGAGDAFITDAQIAKADVYISSDLRHHPVQDSREAGIASSNDMALIDISHWAAEWLWLEVAAEQLSKLHQEVSFEVSTLRTDPWDFVITQ